MNSLMESLPRRHRITADEYHRMAEVGLLAPDARVELIDGEIIDMAPIGTDHNSVVLQLTHALVKAVGDCGLVLPQGSIRLDEYSEPQPDFAVFAPSPHFYRRARPTLAEMLLVIEVSNSSLRYDRDRKVPFYARHGIPEVWIVDLQHGELRVYREPVEDGYREQRVTAEPGRVGIAALPGVGIDFAGILAG
ncbi:MAG TPA: Uma2 family endonuclease [Steroidobacteraceae bacterium]|nr:Uma2 family endonuclease [Steroidobacteraceae bacterium]